MNSSTHASRSIAESLQRPKRRSVPSALKPQEISADFFDRRVVRTKSLPWGDDHGFDAKGDPRAYRSYRLSLLGYIAASPGQGRRVKEPSASDSPQSEGATRKVERHD